MYYNYLTLAKELYNHLVYDCQNELDYFWTKVAGQLLWHRKWDKLFEGDFRSEDRHVKWLINSKFNISSSCLDNHAQKEPNRIAIYWEPNNPNEPHREYNYIELFYEVAVVAEMLRRKGVKKGDRVGIYMGNIPELPIAMLGCARVGAVHVVMHSDYRTSTLKEIIEECEISFIITCDGAFSDDDIIPLKANLDEAIKNNELIRYVLVVNRTNTPINLKEGRDYYWEELVLEIDPEIAIIHPATVMDPEEPLFIVYSSGARGKPNPIVYSSAGFMLSVAYTFVNIFQYDQENVFFGHVNMANIAAHAYLVYGPFLCSAHTVLYEGKWTYPNNERLYQIIEKYKVHTILTTPRDVKSLIPLGTEAPAKYRLESLLNFAITGDMVPEEITDWLEKYVNKNYKFYTMNVYITAVSGGALIANPSKIFINNPGYAGRVMPGLLEAMMFEGEGEFPRRYFETCKLAFKAAWPGLAKTIYNNHELYLERYYSEFPDWFYTGDLVMKDMLKYFKIVGREEDCMEINGIMHGPGELENCISNHPQVLESAIVTYPPPHKKTGLYAFVVLFGNVKNKTVNEINEYFVNAMGSSLPLDYIQIVTELPRTYYGNTLRRILRHVLRGNMTDWGNTMTFANPECMPEIIDGLLLHELD